MSYTSDFYNALNNKKKKKQNTQTTATQHNLSYEDEFYSKLNEDKKDIAPIQYKTAKKDIAPVRSKSEEEEDDSTWFQGGAFSDGYDFGDITKTIIGTFQDVNENITTAVFDATENLIDTTAYGIGYIGSLFDEDFKDDVGEFIAEEILTPKESGEAVATYANPVGWANLLVNGGETEENSLLGDKADGLVQSGAHLVGSYALQMVGVPAWLTQGVNAFGSEIESAFQQGATYEEAGISGGISALAEVAFEKLSSGIKFKGGTFDDGLQKWIKNNITNKITRSFVKYGVDVVGEGVEEVATEYASALGRKITYMDDKEWNEIISTEDAFDAFIGGAIMSGVSGGGKLAKSAKTGRDYVTGLNSSEDKVVSTLYEETIAEAEKKKGAKLTSTEKNKIYDAIVERMDKGDIDIDTIERILGGDDYTAYKDTIESEESLKNEFETLRNTKKGDLTDVQEDRLKELKGMNLDDTTKRNELRAKLDEILSPLLKNSRLTESYNERARKSQAFEADLEKYKGVQRTAVERAIKSGVLNNTNKSHALVETLSQIEADKGIIFNYADNAKLKESGFAIDGKTVNGFEKNGEVTLNVQSAKSWQSTVGHEITHVLEGTESYGELQAVLFKYAESKGELASRKAALTELYKGIDADIDKELTADLVGDYLFTDSDFIKTLTGNKPLWKKIYDEIKYLYKVATGKEKVEIEKVKRAFDNAWKEFAAESVTAEDDGKVNLSVSTDSNGNNLSLAVQKRFANSKAVDENGDLKVLYHGTASGEFYTFDKSKGNVEGDFGSGFYFTDNETDVENNYEDGGPDFENKVARRAEQIQNEEDIDYDEAEKRAREELYKGGNKHTVYLNIENPAIVGETYLFEYDSFAEEYDRDDYDSDEDYEGDVENLIADKIDEIIWDIDRNVDIYSTDGIAEVLWNAVNEGGIGIEQLKSQINDLYLEDNNGNSVGNEVTRQIIESLGYDGIIDNTVSSKFNMNMEEDTTHYIVFKPNQIKSIENQNPTDDPDIRFSVSEERLENIGKILYNNNSPLAIVNRANSNNNSSIKWVYKAEIFSVTENKLFHEKISEINQGSQAFQKNSIDEYMLPIENKIVFTDGNYETPYISEIVEVLTDSQTEFETIKERIFNVEKGKSSKQDAVRTIKKMFGDGIVITHRSGNGGVYGWEDGRRKGKTRRDVVRNYLNKFYGRGNDNQINETKADLSGSAFLNADTQSSLSNEGEQFAPIGNYSTPLNETALAPMQDVADNTTPTETVVENTTVEDAPMPITEEEANALQDELFNSITDVDAPPVTETEYYNTPNTTALDEKTLTNIGKSLRDTLYLTSQETKAIQEIVQEYSTSEMPDSEELFDIIKEKFGEKVWKEKNQDLAEVKRFLRTSKINVSPKTKSEIADYGNFKKSIGSKLGISKNGLPVDVAYQQLVEMYPAYFSEDIWNETDQFLRMAEVASMDLYKYESQPLDDDTIQKAVDIISDEVVNYKNTLNRTAAEDTAREALDSIAPSKAEQLTDGSRGEALLNQSLDNFPIETVEDKVAEKIRAVEGELADNKQLRRETESNYDEQIAELTKEYLGLKNKNSKKADGIVRRIARLNRLKASADADYAKRISDLEARAEKMKDPKYSRAMHKKAKMQEHADWAAKTLGDTSTWKDKKTGLQYATNTEHRNLRDIVRDENGNKDIARADAIYDATMGEYNRNQAARNRRDAEINKKYEALKVNRVESVYANMLGELRHNPETTLTEKVVNEYYEKHKNKIDTEKVDKFIDYVRSDLDTFFEELNTKLREQGMKEIPYRKGYFPHRVEPKQNFIQKLLNWKTQDNEIPTSIAGLTEDFKPVKSWQSFDKQRHSDETDYDLLRLFQNYKQGALDWIYHLEDIQKRRAIENHIRYTHSDEGIQAKIKEVYANEEFDADEAQAQIEHILAEAKNPLNNFIQDFTTKTNILAGKKNSLDRTTEQMTNRKIYTVMMNVQNRLSANMVLANVRSALTNFIPITQSWAQVSPLRSLQAAKDTIANAIKDDGTIEKSTFLTNRLREADSLYKTNWDKVLDKAGIMFEIVDNFSSQVIWRSKYNQNIANGMSESEAIANADQFAENVMAGRSKGNEPTLFNAKNPLVKAFTMFQLEVNNQYGYFFKDAPNDLKAETNHWKLNLTKGFTTAFVGAYVYNALMEQITGSGAALDPIGIIEDLLRDLGLFDEDEEKEADEVITNLVDNVVEELPFVGSFFGGGRVPISSALPYEEDGLTGFVKDIGDGNWGNFGKEMMNPLLNVGLPVGGGQIKKTYQGLSMFDTDEDHPVAGSYTDSGALRFPVEDTFGNRVQAAIFGQYASENAREYFDNGYAPLKEKQIQEYVDVELPIADYWKYRDGLKGLKTNAEKANYINSLDIADWQKNLLMNNILDRKEDVDMSNYNDYNSFEEFDYAQKNPEKYAFFKDNGISYTDYANADEDGKAAYTWAYNNPEKYKVSKVVANNVVEYRSYTSDLYDIRADKDAYGETINGSAKEKKIEYINNLDLEYGQKIILFKMQYKSDDTYNADIIDYVNNLESLTYEDRITIFTELGFTVQDGYVYWD